MKDLDPSLPCPFCGTRPEDLQPGPFNWSIYCPNCRVTSERTVFPKSAANAEKTKEG